LFQIAIIENELMYDDLPCNTLAERIKKAKFIEGLTQENLAKLTGLSRSTINELEAGYRDNINRDTLNNLLKVLDKDIICDDYLNYILNQEENVRGLISTYSLSGLCKILSIHRSTIERWRNGRFQISRKYFESIKQKTNNLNLGLLNIHHIFQMLKIKAMSSLIRVHSFSFVY